MSRSTPTDDALRRATMLCELGRYREAAPLLRSFLAGNPQNQEAICRLSHTHLILAEPEEALRLARIAIANAPDNDWGYRLASVALRQLDQPGEAATLARSAIRCAPLASTGFRILAQALVATGELVEAREAAERGLQLAPHSADAHLVVGTVAAAAGRSDDAAVAYHQCLRIEPDNSAAHNALARLQLKRTRFGPRGLATAAGGFATAARTDPTSGIGRRNLDLVLHVFLARVAYGVFIAAYIGDRLSADGPAWARTMPALILVAPLLYAARFVMTLNAVLRRYLAQLLRRPTLAAAVVCDGVAVVSIGIAAFPIGNRPAVYLAAALSALLARIILWTDRKRRLPAPRSSPLVSTALLVIIAVSLFVMTVFLVLVSRGDGTNTAAALIAAAVCAAASFAATRTLFLRRRRR